MKYGTEKSLKPHAVESRVEAFNMSHGTALAAFSIEFAADRRPGHLV